MTPTDAPILTFANAAAFGTWLSQNYQLTSGIWVKVAKKDSGIPSVTSDELVDVGLCWGWISGQRRSLDAQYYLQKYVPRRKQSIWSQVNVAKVAKLTAAGRMQAPGLAEVAAAKADGRWDAAYTSQRNAIVPQDLGEALAKNQKALAIFESLSKTDKYMITLQLELAKGQTARAARLEKIIAEISARSSTTAK